VKRLQQDGKILILGLEEGTVKAHLHRAVSRFREEFRQAKEDAP
jgi:DNA-directed RNA polymerase specialized sigma24 family protein